MHSFPHQDGSLWVQRHQGTIGRCCFSPAFLEWKRVEKKTAHTCGYAHTCTHTQPPVRQGKTGLSLRWPWLVSTPRSPLDQVAERLVAVSCALGSVCPGQVCRLALFLKGLGFWGEPEAATQPSVLLLLWVPVPQGLNQDSCSYRFCFLPPNPEVSSLGDGCSSGHQLGSDRAISLCLGGWSLCHTRVPSLPLCPAPSSQFPPSLLAFIPNYAGLCQVHHQYWLASSLLSAPLR